MWSKHVLHISLLCHCPSYHYYRSDRQSYAMAPQTNALALGVVCRAITKSGLRRSPRGLQTRTWPWFAVKPNLDSSLKVSRFQSRAVWNSRSRHYCKRRYQWDECNGRREIKPRCLKRLKIVRVDTGVLQRWRHRCLDGEQRHSWLYS